jgi:hypothetical protein
LTTFRAAVAAVVADLRTARPTVRGDAAARHPAPPKGWADTGIMFGDYYFVEALGRYEKTGGSTAAFMSG